MTSEPRGWDELLLDEVAAELDWPRTPDLRTPVVAAIEGGPAPASRRWPRPALAVAAAALLAFVLLLAIEPARTAVAEFFGLVESERIEFLPTPPRGETATPLPTPVGIEEYGAPSTMEELTGLLGMTPPLPRDVGEPDAIYRIDYEGFGRAPVAVFVYERFDLWQARLTTFGYFGKGLPPGTPVIEEMEVRGRPGYWIAGGNHILRFLDADGNAIAGSQRTVDRNTLVWLASSGITYRIETEMSLDEALAIAETLP